MFLFLFLSLGQLFASQELADKVYQCVDIMARSRSNSDYSIQEVAGACRDQWGQGKIKIEETRLDENTTHLLRVSWGEGKRVHLYSFNIVGSSLCSEVANATNSNNSNGSSPINNLTMNMNHISSEVENTTLGNSCFDKFAVQNDPTSYGLSPGFGYKKNKDGKCEKICPDGQVLTSENFPFLFAYKDSYSFMAATPFVPGKNHNSLLMSKNCVMCPEKKENSLHIKVDKNLNRCVDDHECPEGTEFLGVIDVETLQPGEYIGTMNDSPEGCYTLCKPGYKRSSNGFCASNEKKSCEVLQKALNNMQRISKRFIELSHSAKIGNCDMSKMRAQMSAWKNIVVNSASQSLKTSCKTNPLFKLPHKIADNFIRYLETDRSSLQCLGKVETAAKNLNPEIYALLREDIIDRGF